MNMKKTLRKILSVVAIAATTLSISIPIMADEPNTEAYISKTYNTEVGKAETFSFTATQVKTGTGIIATDHTITIPDISFASSETESTSKVSQINFDVDNFTEAGKYEYTVTESQTATPTVTDNEHEKMIMSRAEYKMDVYVTQDTQGKYVISNIIVNKSKDDNGETATGKVTDIGSTATTNGFKFTNTYVQEAGTGDNPGTPGDDYTNYGSLNISKVITDANGGTDIDRNKEFDFTAKFEFPAGTDKTTLGGVKANGTDITINDDGTCTFKLKADEKEKFTGLPVGTTITVTESGTANYKGKAEIVINGQDQTSVEATKYGETIEVSNQKLGQKKNTVDVTNTYNDVPTTGIIMNRLPYILMLALGGAALIVYAYSRCRKYNR